MGVGDGATSVGLGAGCFGSGVEEALFFLTATLVVGSGEALAVAVGAAEEAAAGGADEGAGGAEGGGGEDDGGALVPVAGTVCGAGGVSEMAGLGVPVTVAEMVTVRAEGAAGLVSGFRIANQYTAAAPITTSAAIIHFMLLGWGRGGGGTEVASGSVSWAVASALAIGASGAGRCFRGFGRVGPPIFSSRRGNGFEAGGAEGAALELARARTVSAPGRDRALSDRGLPSARFCDASLRARRVGLATRRS